MASALRVVKVGGSLLDLAELPQLWRRWRAEQSPAVDVLIPGGGLLADAIRRADATHRLAAVAAHELAIQCMGVTARLLAAVLPDALLLEQLNGIRGRFAATSQAVVVLDLWGCWCDPQASTMLRRWPASWDVTSDTLAAAVARELTANELVLLKSADAPTTDLEELSVRGYVDTAFPRAAAGLNVRLVNLRGRLHRGDSIGES